MKVRSKPPTPWDRGQARRSVNVLVSGFSDQSIVTVEDVTAAINCLPTFHLVGLDQVIYDPEWETRSALALQETGCPRQSKAVFLRDDRKILMFDFDDHDEFRHILYHEIGHHVFSRILDGVLRKRWVMMINPRSRHITRYATRNAMEDFAESYATFVRDPESIERIYRKYVFLRDQVFAGIAHNKDKGHLDYSI